MVDLDAIVRVSGDDRAVCFMLTYVHVVIERVRIPYPLLPGRLGGVSYTQHVEQYVSSEAYLGQLSHYLTIV